MNRYEMTLTVQPEDIDEQGHVNNIRYLQWVQDISRAHWCGEQQKNLSREYAWVARSHYIEYKRPAYLGDRLLVVTWIEKLEGFLSHRRVEVRNADSNRLLVSALTQWCLYDLHTKRPMRIPQEILQLLE